MREDQQKSLFDNSVFNFIRTLFRVAFPVITFTYAARCLGVDGVGQVNFAQSVVSWFSMCALLGMNHYGTREAAKRRADRNILSKFTHEMLLINACTSVLAYILLFLSTWFVPRLRECAVLLWINSAAILLQALGMDEMFPI